MSGGVRFSFLADGDCVGGATGSQARTHQPRGAVGGGGPAGGSVTSVGSWRQGRRVCTPSWLVPTQEPPTQSRGEASAWPPGAAQASAAVALPPGPAVGGVCAQRVRVCVLCRPACSRTCVCVRGRGVK